MKVKRASQLETRRIPQNRAGYRHPLRFEGFLFICPNTKEPVRGEIQVEYTPREASVKAKSFEKYLMSFRCVEIRREAVVNQVMDAIIRACAPRDITVEGHFHLQDGFRVRIQAQHSARARCISKGFSPRR